jgi:hypothetical protein
VSPAALAGHAGGSPPSDVVPPPAPEVLDPLEPVDPLDPVDPVEDVDPPEAVDAWVETAPPLPVVEAPEPPPARDPQPQPTPTTAIMQARRIVRV